MDAIGGLEAIVVDADDPVTLARFWAEMFGTEVVSVGTAYPFYVDLAPVPGVPMIVFQRTEEARSVKNRLHLDVSVVDIEAATERLETLGGRRIDERIGTEVGYDFRAVADPEGNEFCFVKKHEDGRG
jgi:predicted enzyme related to lactoylglutathione lyase